MYSAFHHKLAKLDGTLLFCHDYSRVKIIAGQLGKLAIVVIVWLKYLNSAYILTTFFDDMLLRECSVFIHSS